MSMACPVRAVKYSQLSAVLAVNRLAGFGAAGVCREDYHAISPQRLPKGIDNRQSQPDRRRGRSGAHECDAQPPGDPSAPFSVAAA